MNMNCESTDISYTGTLDLAATFDCGQCFRFSCDEESGVWSGVVRSKLWSFYIPEPGILRISGCSEEEARHFLMLDTDYESMGARFLEPLNGRAHEFMAAAIEKGRGIRILRQDPFETLCSFIISQNNNIPRIKKIVEDMSRELGEPFTDENGVVRYAFPTPEALYEAGVDRIFALKTGFRAKYIYDVAEAVITKRIDFDSLWTIPSAEAVEQLKRLRGVGLKVASCALLFGYGRLDVFPVDIWIKRALADDFTEDFDPTVFGEYAGVAQQYIFYYKRK